MNERERLLRALHDMVDDGVLDSALANEIFAAVYGQRDANREFGPGTSGGIAV